MPGARPQGGGKAVDGDTCRTSIAARAARPSDESLSEAASAEAQPRRLGAAQRREINPTRYGVRTHDHVRREGDVAVLRRRLDGQGVSVETSAAVGDRNARWARGDTYIGTTNYINYSIALSLVHGPHSYEAVA